MKAVGFGAVVLAACAAETTPPDDVELPRGTALVTGVCTKDFASSWPYFVSTAQGLFWISPCDPGIRRASKLDGAVELLVGDEPYAAMLAADETDVYWTRVWPGGTGELVKASQVDRSPVVLASAQDQMYAMLPQQLLVDDTTVYRSEVAEVLSMPKDGSAPQQVFASGSGGPFLAADGEYIYWANMTSVHRQRKGTFVDEELAQAHSVIFHPIAVTEAAVFFWDGALRKIDKRSGGPAVSIHSGDPDTRAFVSDRAGSLYWQTGGAIVRATEDGVVTPIVRASGYVHALAVDDARVYWIDWTGTILFAEK